jgi:phosphate-selective porin OprO/OprP
MLRFLAALTLGAATLFPAAAIAADGETMSLEERVARLEALLGLEGLASEEVANTQAGVPALPPAFSAAAMSGATAAGTTTTGASPAGETQAMAAAPPPLAVPPAAAAPSEEPVWSFANNRPLIRSADSAFSLAFRGRLQFDAGSFHQDSNLPASVSAGRDLRNGAHFRRAQLGVEGKVFRDFEYEFVFDFGSSGTERAGQIYLMRLGYTGIPHVTINAGAIQPKFTLDDSTSSGDLTFMERSSIVNTLLDPYGGSDSRRGLEVRYQSEDFLRDGDNLLLAATFTGARIAETKTDDEGTQILGRAAYRFHSDATSNFQIGVNAARIVNHPDGGIAIGDRPETRVDGTRLVGFGSPGLAPEVGAKSGWMWGLEAAANYGPFTMQGEYFRHTLERSDTALKDPAFSGWYVQGSYMLTGESRPYNTATAAFGAPAPLHPFDRDDGGWGAWEVKARYSVNDLDAFVFDPNPANRVRGGEQRIIGTGVNWYMNRNVRWLFDYSIVDINRLDAVGLEAGQDFEVMAARMQFSF